MGLAKVGAQALDQPAQGRRGELRGDRLRHLRPDALGLHELLGPSLQQAVDRAELVCQAASRDVAHLLDPDREQDAVKRSRAGCIDRVDQVARGDLGEAIELEQLLGAQVIEIGGVAHESAAEKRSNECLTEPVDVHRSTRDEVT